MGFKGDTSLENFVSLRCEILSHRASRMGLMEQVCSPHCLVLGKVGIGDAT